ncbi:MAG: hypothetical protein GX770_08295 [Firmicutes bacterium]|nr:hypothetical protein [Bacillota bacterium]
MSFNQEFIHFLISCPKRIKEAPKKEMVCEKGHLRNNMKLISDDGKFEFEVFIRVNQAFPENFSIGLVYIPRDGTSRITLLRYNGPHGPQNSIDSHHASSHIHIATEENISKGLRAEKSAILNYGIRNLSGRDIFFCEKMWYHGSRQIFSLYK